MAIVMNVHSIDGWIKFRVCSEVWHTGVFGDCVVVKYPVVIPFDIIYFLGLQIMPLNLFQVEISTTQKQWTWQLRYSTECICEDKYMDKIRLKMLYPLFWTHDFCWIVCILKQVVWLSVAVGYHIMGTIHSGCLETRIGATVLPPRRDWENHICWCFSCFMYTTNKTGCSLGFFQFENKCFCVTRDNQPWIIRH